MNLERAEHLARNNVCGSLGDATLNRLVTVNGVALWLADLDIVNHEESEAWLSPSETARAHRFVFERDASRYRAAHIALRQLLWAHCGRSPRTEFAIGAHGKPSCGGSEHCQFNLSHSGSVALVGIGNDGEFGVDIELVRPIDDLRNLGERVFGDMEKEELGRSPPDEIAQAFLRGWTRKEACLKALGTGLSLEPNSFETGLSANAKSLDIATDLGLVKVSVQSVDLGVGVVAAVAHIVA